MKNRIHAKRAAAKREKRATKKEIENDILQTKAARLIVENEKLERESSKLYSEKVELEANLKSHRQHMNTLYAQLAQMQSTIEKIERANNASKNGSAGTHSDAERGGSGRARSPVVAQPQGVYTTDERASLVKAVGRSSRLLDDDTALETRDGNDINLQATVVPDALLTPISPDVELSLDQFALSLDMGWSSSETRKSETCSVGLKHKIDDVLMVPSAQCSKRVRLLKSA